MTPSDLLVCERKIREKLPVIFFKTRSASTVPEVINSTEVFEMGKEVLEIAMARPQDIGSIKFKLVANQDYYSLDIVSSPAVEINRCYFMNNILRRGRLFYVTKYFDESGTAIEKDAEFLGWAQDVMQVTKAGMIYDKKEFSYLGTEAEDLQKTSTCKFVV